jgi:hypothetical protein
MDVRILHFTFVTSYLSMKNRQKMLNKDPSGNLQIVAAKFTETDTQFITWIERDLGPAVQALLKNYDIPEKEIIGSKYHVGTARMTYPDFAKILSNG